MDVFVGPDSNDLSPHQHAHRAAAIAMVALGGLLLFGRAAPAQAAPPPVGSEDWKVMAPFAEWVRSQHDRGGYWCCDIGDGRPVEARIAGDHWEAHITPEHWPGQTDHWVVVPDDRITRGGNPTGTPILWLLSGRVQCFAPPDAV